MERVVTNRLLAQERLLRGLQKAPREDATSGNVLEYPYAWTQTYRFLKAAIAEGAHKVLPERLQNRAGGSDIWIKKRNIAGLYFSTKLVEDDLGIMYGYGANSRTDNPNRREGPRQHITSFLKLLWENCSAETRRAFPLRSLYTGKPESRSKPRMKRVVRLTSKSARDYPLLDPIFKAGLEAKIKTLPPLEETNGERRFLFKYVTRAFYERHRELFASASECVRLAGVGTAANRRSGMIEAVWTEAGIPFKPVRRSRKVSDKEIPDNNELVVFAVDSHAAADALRLSGRFTSEHAEVA